MKKSIFLFLLVGITACEPVVHFQVFKVEPDNLTSLKNALVFENDQCKILYNLWERGGNIGFIFFNKTDKTIFLDKAECFFIINGIANDYFQNRTYTKSSLMGVTTSKGGAYSKSSGSQSTSSDQYAKSETNLQNALSSGILTTETTGSNISNSETNQFAENSYFSVGVHVSKGYSVAINESSIIRIPPKSFKFISEFNILTSRYFNCDLVAYPTREIKSLTFTKSNSPYIFRNRICYKLDSLDSAPIYITNSFYVSEVSNMPPNQFFYQDYETVCGERSFYQVKFRKFAAPDKFFIEY
jgi:hypothetical protein